MMQRSRHFRFSAILPNSLSLDSVQCRYIVYTQEPNEGGDSLTVRGVVTFVSARTVSAVRKKCFQPDIVDVQIEPTATPFDDIARYRSDAFSFVERGDTPMTDEQKGACGSWRRKHYDDIGEGIIVAKHPRLDDREPPPPCREKIPYEDYNVTYDPRKHKYVYVPSMSETAFVRRYCRGHADADLSQPLDIPRYMCDFMNRQFHAELVDLGLKPPPFENYELTKTQFLMYREMNVSRQTDKLHVLYASGEVV